MTAKEYFLKRYPLYKDISTNELTFFKEKFYEMLEEYATLCIAERMPTEEEIEEEAGLLYSKEIFIEACKWFRSRMEEKE
jgi:hypothetical protein